MVLQKLEDAHRSQADVAELEAPAGKMKTEGVWCKVISCLILAGWLAPCARAERRTSRSNGMAPSKGLNKGMDYVALGAEKNT